ncbi:uncharacterized protein L203_100880 [Cryptococcus depauperatus CBS 7841]|uniref:Uncharacterized protein n=1 Tax=Cryptococcus depauperatus CBS 7841 TaxID=1295531 RepID=A0AAJ8JP18_9TREE
MASNMNAHTTGTAGTDPKSHSFVPGSNADGSAGANTAQGLGDKVKGGWNGTGEGIRGNFNAFVDNIGEQIAGRDPAQTAQQPSAGGERPSGVAARGADEIRMGMDHLKK